MKRLLLVLLLLPAPTMAQVPPVPPLGAFCLPTVASTHTQVNPSTGNTIVTMWCDLTSGLYHYGVSGSSANWQQAQCLTSIEPLSPTAVWLQHAWSACVTTTMNASDQAYANRLFVMWVPRPTVLGNSQPVLTLNADGSLGSQLKVSGVAQTILGGTGLGGLRVPSGTVSPRYCNVSGYTSVQGSQLPSNTFALCSLLYPPLGGFQYPPSPDQASISAPTEAFLVDSSHHIWGIDSKGIVTVDGIEDSTTANVVTLFFVGGLIWQNAGTLWWSKASPTAPWLPSGGTTTPPI